MCNGFTERREFPRFDLEYTAQLISPNGDLVITALTSNICDGGMRLPLPGESLPECGIQTQVHLSIPRGALEYVRYSGYGKVIRHTGEDDDGVAEIVIQFLSPLDLRLQEEILDGNDEHRNPDSTADMFAA